MFTLWQNQELIYVIYTGIALGVFLLFTGFAQIVNRSEDHIAAKNRRMRMITKGSSTQELLAFLNPTEQGSALTRLPFIGDLDKDFRQAGLTIRPDRFLWACLLLVLAIGVAGSIIFEPIRGILAGFVLGFVAPVAVIKHLKKKRIEALIHQLPDSLDLLARGLRVGHPLNTSIGAVAEEMQDPVGTEFGIIFDQVSYGDDLTDAFTEFAERMDIEDVYYLSASIGIQHGTGGDLARVIQVLSHVIRGRIAMRRKILAISSEGRLTMWFLSALPIIIYVSTSLMSPDYYAGVRDDPMFVPMALMIVFFATLNFLILRKLVNFRI